MRVLHLTTAWPRTPDDVVTPWLVALCRRLADRGHEVEVLTPAYRGLGGQRTGDIVIHRFRYAPARWERLTHEETTPDRLARSPAWGLALPPYLVAGAAAAWRLGRRRRYDVVHVHWALPHGAFGLAARRGSGAGATLVTTFYGAEIRFAERVFRPAARLLGWYCRRSRLIAISESTRRMVARHTDHPVVVVPYGVPLPPAPADGRPPPTDPPTLLFVGRLVARKGVDRLIEALAGLADRRWRLEVVGFGPERERLERTAERLSISDRVAFLGRLADDELAEAYRRATAFVLPATVDERADTEGLGVVLLEAMSYGVPVVATRRGGIVDVVVDGETGLLVEDEIDAIAGGIARVLDDPARARTMGERGRERVERAFAWETILDRIEAVYRGAPPGAEEGA